MKKADRKRSVPLLELAHARSGDTGDTANVGLIALKPEYYPILVKQVTAARVARHFKGMITGEVERFELPNLHALNFLLHGALDGGGTISLKTDAQERSCRRRCCAWRSRCPGERAGARRVAGWDSHRH